MPHHPETALTISQLTQQLKSCLADQFSRVLVRGEISEFVRAASGHIYLTLKDDQARLSGVIWKSTAQSLRFELEEGQEVICQGAIDIYPPRGSYQLTIRSVMPVGIGALQLAYRQLHAKLEREGLFAAGRKRPIPAIPRRIVVVTSPQGAAIRDFLEVIERRWPHLDILIAPTRVQGSGASREIAEAIQMANHLRPAPDVLVVCRGGGSLEDLWSFNEEPVCRAIFESQVPVVTGIGHEIDVTLADLVADVRALTPTEAAERIAPRKSDILKFLSESQIRLVRSLTGRIRQAYSLFRAIAERPIFRRPLDWIRTESMRLDDLRGRLDRLISLKMERGQRDVAQSAARLQSLSPLEVLSRGYSVTSAADGRVLKNVDALSPGDEIKTRLARGGITSRVIHVESRPTDKNPK